MIAWENIDSVFLDMDGTLLDLNFDNHFWQEFVPRRWAEREGLALDEAKALLAPRFRAMEGRLEWYCLDYWSGQLDLDIAAMKEEVAGMVAVLPHVVEFLDAARLAGKRLALVTNAHRKSLGLKMERTRLRGFFDSIVSSHDLGHPKEDAEFWRRLGAVEPFAAGRTLLADDSLPVLRAARAFGIGHLVAIRKHDSARPARAIDECPAIVDFREIMPGR